MRFVSSNPLIFPFSWISLFILCSMAIFLPTINCWNEEKCGGIFLNEMGSFEFEKINIGEKVPKNNQKVHFLKANGDKDHGLVSSVFMGYMYQNDKTYTPKNCIAVKLTPNDEEHLSPAKNNIETINAIQQYEHHHEHTKYLINVLYLGTTPENYVTIMEMAEGSHRQIWKIRNFAEGNEGEKEIGKEAKKFLLPLVEFHKIGLIHGDVKRANYVFVHSNLNNNIDHDHKVNEHLKRADSKARANFKMAPFWPDRWGIFHGPEFGKKESEIQVNTCQSPVFRAMFENEMIEAKEGIVKIKDIKSPVLEQMIIFMYSGKAPKLAEMTMELLEAEDKYELDTLKKLCTREFATSLGNENACELLVLADQYSAKYLKKYAIKYLQMNANEVMETSGWKMLIEGNNHAELISQIFKTTFE